MNESSLVNSSIERANDIAASIDVFGRALSAFGSTFTAVTPITQEDWAESGKLMAESCETVDKAKISGMLIGRHDRSPK